MPIVRTTLRRHWLFAVLLGLGFLIRLITWLAYRPAMLYIDSFRYLFNLRWLAMDGIDPVGYTLILWPLLYTGKLLFGAGIAFTAAVQHLLGLAIAVVMYRICRGLGAARWAAAVITIPILFDGYQLHIEENLMAEVWSDAFLLAAVWLLLAWRFRRRGDAEPQTGRFAVSGPLWWQAAAAGALIAANVPIRIIGGAAVVPFVAYLVFVGARWRDRAWWRTMTIRLAAGVAGFGIVFGGYTGIYRLSTGHGGLSGGGDLLYGRAAQVAKCDQLPLDDYLAQVCPKEPLGQRLGVDVYAHTPMLVYTLPPGVTQDQLRNQFAKLVFTHQPLDVAASILHDFLKGFAWSRTWSRVDTPLYRWQFQVDYPRWYETNADPWTLYFDGTRPYAIKPLSTFMRGYQLSVGYTPGTLLGVAGLIGVAGMLRRRPGQVSLRVESMLTVGMALALLGGAAIFEFSWRYQLPGLVFLPLAGAIGFTAWTKRDETKRDETKRDEAKRTEAKRTESGPG